MADGDTDENKGSFIEQIYNKLDELFGNEGQLFCMEFPGRVLNENLYRYDTNSIYSNITKPQAVIEEEFSLSNQLFDVYKIVGGPNGKRLSDVYYQTLNTLIPIYPKIEDTSNVDKAKLRSWLLGKIEIQDDSGKNKEISRIQLYEKLAQKYVDEVKKWKEDKQDWFQNYKEDPEEFAKKVAIEGPSREEKISFLYNDLVIRGYYHEVNEYLGHLDNASESEVLETLKSRLRNSAMLSVDESQTIYPVSFQPNDWFKSLNTDYEPVDLLKGNLDLIEQKIIAKKSQLNDLIAKKQLLISVPEGDVKSLKDKVEDAQGQLDKAESDMINQFASNTVEIVKMYLKAQLTAGIPIDTKDIKKEPINKELEKNGQPPISDDDLDALLEGFKKSTEAQTKLDQASRALTELESQRALAQSSDTKLQIVALDAQIKDLQYAINVLENNRDLCTKSVYSFIYQITEDNVKPNEEILKPLVGKKFHSKQEILFAIENCDKSNKITDNKEDLVKKFWIPDTESNLLPSSAPTANEFFEVNIEVEEDSTVSEVTKNSASSLISGKLNLLIASVGGQSLETSSKTKVENDAAKYKFQIAFRATKVTFERKGWFDPSVYNLTSNMQKDSESAGEKISGGTPTRGQEKFADINKTIFPAFPISMIIVKDVGIRITSTSQKMDSLHDILDKSSEISGGFLCFGVSHSQSSHSDVQSFHTRLNSSSLEIRIPGPQIIGWYLEYVAEDKAKNYTTMPDNYLPPEIDLIGDKGDKSPV